MTERERQVRLKLVRGRVQIAALAQYERQFWMTNARVEQALDRAARQRHFIMHLAKPAPVEEWSLAAGDAVHNLRSALDHLVWQLVESHGKKPGRHTAFPIVDDEARFTKSSDNCLRGVSAAAVRAIKALKPWQGGNEQLWRLHHLDICDKHRLLLLVATAYAPSLDLGKSMERAFPDFGHIPSLRLALRPAAPEFTNGTILCVENLDGDVDESQGSRFDPQFQLSIEIVLGEKDRHHLIAYLTELADVVDRVISSLGQFLV